MIDERGETVASQATQGDQDCKTSVQESDDCDIFAI
jgi:hypothetical protein